MELQNQKHLGLMWVGCRHQTKVRPTPGGGGEDHHLPHQNALEEQILMTIQQPVSLVEATGIGDASRQKEDWHQ